MDTGQFLLSGGGLGGFVAAFMEFFVKRLLLKPLEQKYQWGEEKYTWIVTVFALVLGWITALAASTLGIPLPITGVENNSLALQVFLAGPIIVFGNGFWHEFYDFFENRGNLLRQNVITVTNDNRIAIPPALPPPEQTAP